MTLSLDTLAIVRRLTAAGFSEDQAEAVTNVIRDARDLDVANLVTKADLRAGIAEIVVKIEGIRSELKIEIGGIRSEFKGEIGGMRSELLKWFISIIGVQTLVVISTVIALTRGLH